MDAHLIDSAIFGHLWSSTDSREIFAERSRLARWVKVIAALARAQAVTGIIPAAAAEAISAVNVDDLDISRIAAGTRATSHSTLGLIHELQSVLPASAREYVYYGVTVQDITDTSLAIELRDIGAVVWNDLWNVEATLIQLATTHRSTPMNGRTHGQPGAPITFGFKVASWLDELGRQMIRLCQGRERWLVAQLGGAVGTLGFFGGNALALRREFAADLGLAEPTISWLTARDRLAEFANVMAMTTATLARIANEVYSLQRLEIGELLESSTATTVGSITMPHKRNPESSEQIVTLARLVRVQAGLLTETMVQEHERDARGWKAEWVAFPELCHYATAASALSRVLVDGIEVRPSAMLSNLRAAESTSSEQLLRHLSEQLGKHNAQAALNEAYRIARETGRPITELLPSGAVMTEPELLLEPDLGAAPEMVDLVIAATARRRANESHSWSS
jgi:adenylosuccinate lyase